MILIAIRRTPAHIYRIWSLTLIFLASASALEAALVFAEQPRHAVMLAPAAVLITRNSAAPAAAPPQARRKSALDRRIDNILESSDARRGWWGIQVVELASGRSLYERDANHLFIPASNMKMFTTAAALEKLGPDYVFHTTVESDAAPDAQGHVGNLYLMGRGDPNLGARTFPYTYHGPQQPADKFLQDLADQVKAQGVREVTGTLIADDSYFVWEPFAPNWAADDLEWGYGAPVTALAFNDNLLTLHVKPAAIAGDRASVRMDPVADYFQLKNRVMTSAAGTGNKYSVERLPGSMQLDVWGQIPVDAGEDTDTVAIANPPRLVAELFRSALETRGIAVKEQVEVRNSTRLEAASSLELLSKPLPRLVLAEHDSPPLREAIKVVNKESENLHAEMLLRTLGRVQTNRGSVAGGLEVVNAFAAQQV